MNKIDKQIFKILDKHFPDEMDSSMYHPNLTEDLVSQIKQSILKAIMEGKPKEKLKISPCPIGCEKCRVELSNWNMALKQFELVIKEILK